MSENRLTSRIRQLPSGLSEIRAYRLAAAVRLMDVAVFSGLSLTRASEIERFPERARAGEIERLRETVDRIVADRERIAKSGGAA